MVRKSRSELVGVPPKAPRTAMLLAICHGDIYSSSALVGQVAAGGATNLTITRNINVAHTRHAELLPRKYDSRAAWIFFTIKSVSLVQLEIHAYCS